MFRIALKSLLGHKLRMLLTAFSIIIGVSFVSGSYILTDSMQNSFNDIFEDVYSSVDVIVRPSDLGFGGNESAVPETLVDQLTALDEVDKIEGGVEGIAIVLYPDGTVSGTQGPPSLGFSWGVEPALNPLTIRDENGRSPESPGEIVIDVSSAESNDVEVGTMLSVQVGSSQLEEFEVVGLASFGSSDSLGGATLVAFETREAQRLFDSEGVFNSISMTASDGVSTEELRSIVAAEIPSGLEAISGDQQQAEELDEINQNLGFLTTALLAFATVSIFVGAYIIQNTFRIIVAQRSKELALLRAIGAKKSQIIRMVTYEAFIISLVASVLGILAGIGMSYGLRALVGIFGIVLPDGPLTIEPRTITVSVAVGVVVTLFSAILPALRASRVSPVEAMRDSETSTPRRSLRLRAVAGLLVVGLGLGAMMYGLFADVKDPAILVGFGAAILFLGVSVIAPLLSRPVASLIGWPIELLYRMIGKIAKNNAKRSPRRTASTAAALMIGVSLVVFSSVFAESAKVTIDDIFTRSFPGDITITSAAQQTDPFEAYFPAAAVDPVEDLPEIELVSRIKYDYDSTKVDGSEQLIIGIDPDTIQEVLKLGPTNDNYDNLRPETVYVQQDQLDRQGLTIGDSIEFEFARTGFKSFEITGAFTEPFDSPYMIANETFVQNLDDVDDYFVVANVADGFTLEEGRQAVAEEMKAYPIVSVQDKNQLIAEIRTAIDQILALLSVLLGFAVIIAVLGITNTLTLSVAERTREIGMLRAIGMTRKQVRQMIRFESIIIAVFGALLGFGMGIFFAWAILRSLQDLGFTAFAIPTVQLIGYLIAAIIAGIIAAIAPSFKASRMNILNAINYE